MEKIEVPTAFWASLTEAEFSRVIRTAALDHRLSARLWLLTGRTSKPPARMTVELDKVGAVTDPGGELPSRA